ncbi:hypothetical protein pdam_00023184 [Pocillopora damicornis]|uniref:Uncharacterized protein n=1 Tax=Pocillopora damicornis TaxID=46731 RepID=A0A3M6T608_POCDA|nr:hypothetical protein pdam_00023184 [Pocillopora damicornis]
MKTTYWAVYYLTNPHSWYPVPERARIMSAIPAIKPLPPVPMARQGIQKTREWAASVLCQTGNNDGKSWNFPSYLYQREIQPVEPVGLERSDFEEQQENSGKQDEKEDGTLEYHSPNDDDDILSLEREADFYLGRGFRFGRSIRFNSRIVFG